MQGDNQKSSRILLGDIDRLVIPGGSDRARLRYILGSATIVLCLICAFKGDSMALEMAPKSISPGDASLPAIFGIRTTFHRARYLGLPVDGSDVSPKVLHEVGTVATVFFSTRVMSGMTE